MLDYVADSSGVDEQSYLQGLDSSYPPGPFSPELNGMQSECFGDLSGLSADWSGSVSVYGANAITEGKKMTFDPRIKQSSDDPFSMEVIAHEVAHAIAGGGSGQTEVDEAGDPGEAIAYREGRKFSEFTKNPNRASPQLKAAVGGRARIHRHNSLEHMDAVDGAVDRKPSTSDAEAARPLITKKIELANGRELTAGQVSMLMGDYFAVMSSRPGRERHIDPMASWEQLSNCPKKQLNKLLAEIDKEKTGEANPKTLNDLTDGRYVRMALINDSHFSEPPTTAANGDEIYVGTDNNVGAYERFHELALHQMARSASSSQSSDGHASPENIALALEAGGMHFLTDRHAPGHLMEKHAIQKAVNHPLSGALGENPHVKHVHDKYNAEGMPMADSLGHTWTAYGDGKWFSEENEESRNRVATSVLSSYAELAEVSKGNKSANEVLVEGLKATPTLPRFDPAHQEQAEADSAALSCTQAMTDTAKYVFGKGEKPESTPTSTSDTEIAAREPEVDVYGECGLE